MDKKLHDEIIKIIKCYGLSLKSDANNEQVFSKNSIDIIIDVNKSKVSIYQKGGLIVGFNEEHLSLNAICAVLSNI